MDAASTTSTLCPSSTFSMVVGKPTREKPARRPAATPATEKLRQKLSPDAAAKVERVMAATAKTAALLARLRASHRRIETVLDKMVESFTHRGFSVMRFHAAQLQVATARVGLESTQAVIDMTTAVHDQLVAVVCGWPRPSQAATAPSWAAIASRTAQTEAAAAALKASTQQIRATARAPVNLGHWKEEQITKLVTLLHTATAKMTTARTLLDDDALRTVPPSSLSATATAIARTLGDLNYTASCSAASAAEHSWDAGWGASLAAEEALRYASLWPWTRPRVQQRAMREADHTAVNMSATAYHNMRRAAMLEGQTLASEARQQVEALLSPSI